MNALVSSFNQEMALAGAFYVIVKSSQTFVEPSFQALPRWPTSRAMPRRCSGKLWRRSWRTTSCSTEVTGLQSPGTCDVSRVQASGLGLCLTRVRGSPATRRCYKQTPGPSLSCHSKNSGGMSDNCEHLSSGTILVDKLPISD